MSIQPITPLTVDPIGPAVDDYEYEEDIAERIARDIEQRGIVLSQARRRYAQMNAVDYEVDEIINATYRSCAAVARKYARK